MANFLRPMLIELYFNHHKTFDSNKTGPEPTPQRPFACAIMKGFVHLLIIGLSFCFFLNHVLLRLCKDNVTVTSDNKITASTII